ncbi:MAG: hypothetical protein LJE68_04760 [Rhodobacter sp.]|jgi:hypothetical protein|nr:hypothetical protein [Rhodobacter sp.]
MTPGLGHNLGPSLEPGQSWRAHCWTRARQDLLPKLPIEVVRNRLRRAAEIGLDYRTYATVRASTGRDIVAFLFSTNALRLFRADQAMEQLRKDKLAGLRGCKRTGLAIAPLTPQAVLRGRSDVLDGVAAAPHVHATWSDAARAMDAARGAGLPADGVILVGDTAMERDWSQAGRLAGYLDAARFFTPPA